MVDRAFHRQHHHLLHHAGAQAQPRTKADRHGGNQHLGKDKGGSNGAISNMDHHPGKVAKHGANQWGKPKTKVGSNGGSQEGKSRTMVHR